MKRYVIVGAGPAGVHAATTIRTHDPDGSILLLDRDQDPPYYRTELDTYIAGSTPDDELPLHPLSFYQEQRIEIRGSTVVSRVMPDDRCVALREDERIQYDALLLAPGSHPVAGSWPGVEHTGVMTVRTWEDARVVISRMTKTSLPVVIVGGGVLGIIMAEGIHQRGKRVVLLEREPRLWSPLLDDHASNVILQRMQESGVEVLLGDTVAETFGTEGQLTGLRTTKGRRVETALVIVTIGARPDIAFLAGSGIRTDRGILIDHEFRTNIVGVFAAGDAAQAYDPIAGVFRVVTNWNGAMEQGRLAGSAMAGAAAPYKGAIISNSESFFGTRVSVMGLAAPPGKDTLVVTGRDEAKGLYRRLMIRQDKLVGAILVGNVSGEGMLRKTMLDGKALSVQEAKSKFLSGLVMEEQASS